MDDGSVGRIKAFEWYFLSFVTSCSLPTSNMKQKKAKGVVDEMIAEEVEEDKEEDDDAGDDYDDEYDMEEEEESGGKVKADGLADMMSKILNQKVGDKVPVLAKRKTAMMKEMEGKQGDTERLKRQRVEKRAEREKQLVVPDHTSADFERQLRKLATRGVVALFNAVAKSKKEAADKEAAEKSKMKEEGKHKPYYSSSAHSNELKRKPNRLALNL